MSTESTGGRVKKMHPDEVIEFIVCHDDPGVTAGEIAANFDASGAAARYRLNQLEEADRVYGKSVGSSAKIWFPKG
jgi:predicted transcriptional regulator